MKTRQMKKNIKKHLGGTRPRLQEKKKNSAYVMIRLRGVTHLYRYNAEHTCKVLLLN
jgi:hypothetical protein